MDGRCFAGVPLQLWADWRWEDAHNAGQQGAGRAGHHSQGHPKGLPTPFRLRSHAQRRVSLLNQEYDDVALVLCLFCEPQNPAFDAEVHLDVI